MVYDWKVNVVNINPQIAGDELARIERKYGSLTPESVVDESRDVNAPLHPCFEWNDAVAEGCKVTVRAFVDVSESVKGKFVSIKTALSNDDYKRRVLLNARAELLAFKNKYAAYQELFGVCTEIDKFISSFESDEDE